MEEDQKPFPTMLFANEAYLQTNALQSSEGGIKREDDQSSDICLQNASSHAKECKFYDSSSSHSYKDVVLLTVEKEDNLPLDSTWIKSESEIQVDTDSDVYIDDDNIEIKVERNEEDSILVHDSNEIRSERQVDTDSLISNDYCHTKVENDGSSGYCLPMKYAIGQNQAASPHCFKTKIECDEDIDISFNDACPTIHTDSSLVTSSDMSQEYSKAVTVSLANRIDGAAEDIGNRSAINTVPASTMIHSMETSAEKNETANKECHFCFKVFSQNCHLKTHLLIHTGDKPHKCTVCDKAFTQHAHLKRHLLTHTTDKSHICTVCDKAYIASFSLKRHLLIHMGDRPYKCTVCGKAFMQSSHLKLHMLIHTGVKPHKCTVCDTAFTHKFHLKAHVLIHTGVKAHKCSICDKAFTRRASLKRHLLIHIGDSSYA